jgi:hypothetical protein
MAKSDVQMPQSAFPPVTLTTLTPQEKGVFAEYTQPNADLSGSKDPPNMSALVKRIRGFRWKVNDRPLSVELIVTALRAASFRCDLAADILFFATRQDPLTLAFASTPGQLKYVQHFAINDYGPRSRPEPVNMGKMIEALEGLGLTDDEGRPFCKEVLEAALREAGYRVFSATERLFAVTGQSIRRPCGFWGPYATQIEAIAGLKRLFPQFDWSTLATASADALKLEGPMVATLIQVASRIEELEPELSEEYYDWPWN